MFAFLSVLLVLTAAALAVLPALCTTRGHVRALFLAETLLTCGGLLGCLVTRLLMNTRVSHTADAEYGAWADDLFTVYAAELGIFAMAVVVITVACALLTPRKMKFVRTALPPVAAFLLLLFTAFFALTGENQGTIAVGRYVQAFGLSAALVFHARGAVDDGRRYFSLRPLTDVQARARLAEQKHASRAAKTAREKRRARP